MAKKTLNLDNPAMQFISNPITTERAEAPKDTNTERTPVGYKANPFMLKREAKGCNY